MSGFKFAPLPSHSSIAAFVTLSVSLWFAVASAAIVTQPAGAWLLQPGDLAASPLRPAHATATTADAPATRETITVVARRATPAAAL